MCVIRELKLQMPEFPTVLSFYILALSGSVQVWCHGDISPWSLGTVVALTAYSFLGLPIVATG